MTMIFRGSAESEQARREHEAALVAPATQRRVEHEWLRELCLDAGAGDAGVVEIDRAALGEEGAHARRIFPRVRSLLALVSTSNPEAIRSVSRATANNAWHHNDAELDEITSQVIHRLNAAGVRAEGPPIGFPRRHEPGQTTWEIAHKIVAVEAGMGHMGTNRNVIHPRF